MDSQKVSELKERFSFLCGPIEVDDGWYALIKDLCLKIENALNNSPNETGFEIFIVTKKMGCLRVYTSNTNPYLESLVIEAERQSCYICEECGSKGQLCYRNNIYKVLCEKHRIMNGFRKVKL